MKLPSFLVTTHKTITLVENGKITYEYHGRGRGLLFGITWDSDYLYVGSRNPPDMLESILIFSKQGLKYLGELKFLENHQISGIHQIYYDQNGLHIMNSNKKRITTMSPELPDNKGFGNFNWPEADWATHINSIWQKKRTNLYYIIEHNGGKPPSNLVLTEWQGNKFIFHKRYRNIGLHCHNIHWNKDNSKFTTCSSMEFLLREFDHIHNEETGEMEFRLSRQKQINALNSDCWYLRGLGKTKDFWVVGLSMHQDIRDSDPEKRREKRRTLQNGGVIILDNNWNIVQEVGLNNRGQIHDLRIINELDECHNNISWS
jgi:hypothetical protein